MALILAIDPDKRQSTQLAAMVQSELELGVELLQRGTAHEALTALDGRIPDLVLTSSLMSPREDAALAAHLRELGTASAHVQTVTIPLLGIAAPQRARGMLAALRREKPQPVMTDGCDPAVFAEQVRQYLNSAAEQKAHPPSRRMERPTVTALDTVDEAPAAVATNGFESQSDASYDTYIADPVMAPAFDPLAQPDNPWSDAPGETSVLMAEAAEPYLPHDAHGQADSGLLDEPALALDAPPTLAAFESTEEPLSLELLQDAGEDRTAVPTLELPVDAPAVFGHFDGLAEPVSADADSVHVDPAEAAHRAQFQDVEMDPVATQALAELSRLAPSPSLHDGIPAEPPVNVVEMRSFQSLDAIADELAAEPTRASGRQFQSLDDLASLFAATPSPARRKAQHEIDLYTGPAPEIDLTATMRASSGGFESLFATPSAPVAEDTSSLVLGIDPGLFATPPPRARGGRPQPRAWEPEPRFAAPEPIVVEPPVEMFETAILEPVLVHEAVGQNFSPVDATEPTTLDAAPTVETVVEAAVEVSCETVVEALANTVVDEPIAVPEIDPKAFVDAEPEPVVHLVECEPAAPFVELAAADAAVDAPEPIALDTTAIADAVADQPVVATAPLQAVAEAAAADAEPVAVAWELEQSRPAFEATGPEEPAVRVETAGWEFEPAAATAPETIFPAGDTLGDQLDRAAAAQPAPPVAATPFADFDPFEEVVVDFTLVDEPDPMAVATAPPEAAPAPAAAAAPPAPFTFTFVDGFGDELADFVNQPEETITLSTSGPVLDDDALSLIGDAALKASLDAFVIEEFGGKRQPRKPAVKAHAGATQLTPVDRKGRKRPVQDEWGMFDPEQCGFAALEDDEKKNDPGPNAQVRVITY